MSSEHKGPPFGEHQEAYEHFHRTTSPYTVLAIPFIGGPRDGGWEMRARAQGEELTIVVRGSGYWGMSDPPVWLGDSFEVAYRLEWESDHYVFRCVNDAEYQDWKAKSEAKKKAEQAGAIFLYPNGLDDAKSLTSTIGAEYTCERCGTIQRRGRIHPCQPIGVTLSVNNHKES